MKTQTNFKITLTTILFILYSISGNLVGQTSTNDGDLSSNESHTYKTISPGNNWTSYTYSLWSGNNNLKSRQYRFHNDSVEVDGKWYFQLQWTRSQEDENWNNLELYREENGRIFVYAWGAESLLMDFNFRTPIPNANNQLISINLSQNKFQLKMRYGTIIITNISGRCRTSYTSIGGV